MEKANLDWNNLDFLTLKRPFVILVIGEMASGKKAR